MEVISFLFDLGFRKFDIRFLFPIASPGSAPSSSDRQLRRIPIEEVSIEYVGCDRSDIVMYLIFDGSDIVVDLIFDGSDIVVDLIL